MSDETNPITTETTLHITEPANQEPANQEHPAQSHEPLASPGVPVPPSVKAAAPTDAPKPGQFTAAQVAHAKATGRPSPSHDVRDPTHSSIIGSAPAGVIDEASAVAHARRTRQWTKVPNHPQGHFARPDGSVGPWQSP